MNNLHIQTKQQKGLLNLKVVAEKEKFPVLVEKKKGKITLISEEKTYYLESDAFDLCNTRPGTTAFRLECKNCKKTTDPLGHYKIYRSW